MKLIYALVMKKNNLIYLDDNISEVKYIYT